MIYEIALFPVQKMHIADFSRAFAQVAPLLRRAKGYEGHFLAQGIEAPQNFSLIVRWQSLEDHSPGFEASEDHRLFMMGLEHYLSGEPSVYHVEGSPLSGDESDGANGTVGMGSSSILSFPT